MTSLWDIPPQITSGFSLAAFALALAAWLVRRGLRREQGMIETASPEHRASLVDKALTHHRVKSDDLDPARRYQLARAELGSRERRYLYLLVTILLLAVTASAVLAATLLRGPQKRAPDERKAALQLGFHLARLTWFMRPRECDYKNDDPTYRTQSALFRQLTTVAQANADDLGLGMMIAELDWFPPTEGLCGDPDDAIGYPEVHRRITSLNGPRTAAAMELAFYIGILQERARIGDVRGISLSYLPFTEYPLQSPLETISRAAKEGGFRRFERPPYDREALYKRCAEESRSHALDQDSWTCVTQRYLMEVAPLIEQYREGLAA